MTSTGEGVTFWILAVVAVVAACALLFARKAVHAAIGMVVTMICLGVLYLISLEAPFLGVVHVFVYTGAVMMLFLFVVMLVGVDHSDSVVETLKGQRLATAVLVLGLVGLLVTAVGRVTYEGTPSLAGVNGEAGNIPSMAGFIFGPYVWLFEITSALLITAAMGAMVLAHRERLSPRPSQREWSERRFKEGKHLSGLPVPGVYARHNAVDTPALLPDGSISELSINKVLAARDQVTVPTRYTDLESRVEGELEDGRQR